MMQYKNATGGIADVDKKKNTVIGYAAHFGNKDSHGDIINKGAFKRTLQHNSKRVKTLMHHDPVMIIGRPETMSEDDKGLYTETKVSDTAYGRDLLTLIEDGVMDEMSIGYITVQEKYDEEARVNFLNEVKLVEYSFVALASNEDARVQGLKSVTSPDQVMESMKRMEKSLRDGTFESSEMPERIEFALRYWRSVLEGKAAHPQLLGGLRWILMRSKPN
ncbi:MAG: HK97 family phage prohead protease [Actinobacteria bacterium]|nr:HK97 family phage prohead protease [Actinomycetota bacterium]